MGILSRFRRKKGKEKQLGDKTYILTRKRPDGGMEKVMDLAKDATPDELYPSLAAGVYAVHIYTKGQSGFDSGPIFEVTGEVGEKTEPSAVKKSPFSGMKEFLIEWKEMKDDAKSLGALFAEMFSEKKVTMDDAMGYFETLKKHKTTLDSLFPGSTTKSNEIPVTGSIPAWMAYAPQVVDQSLNTIEARLGRWGLIDTSGQANMSKEEDPIKLPDRPRAIEQEKTKDKKVAADKEITIDLPDKPVVEEKKKEEVREETVEEEKEEEEKEDGES